MFKGHVAMAALFGAKNLSLLLTLRLFKLKDLKYIWVRVTTMKRKKDISSGLRGVIVVAHLTTKSHKKNIWSNILKEERIFTTLNIRVNVLPTGHATNVTPRLDCALLCKVTRKD